MSYKVLTLAKGKEKALKRSHPWVFSGAFKKLPPELEEGEIVEIHTNKGQLQATGFFHPGRIAVRVLNFGPIDNFEAFLESRIQSAIEYRQVAGLFQKEDTNCFRLVFGEGDSLPGLVIDRYGSVAVIQIHLSAWIPYLAVLTEILMRHEFVSGVYSKPVAKFKDAAGVAGWLTSTVADREVTENGHRFLIDWEDGQKTGFFLDQRENRQLLGEMSRNRSVLNTFSYTGGFSVYALKAGASKAVSVDISEAAVELAIANAKLNAVDDRHEAVASDVFEYLSKMGDQFDIIVLDPPAFSKSIRSTHNAIQAYKRLNRAAIQKIKDGGVIFTFSCSQHIGPQLFEDTVRAAAIGSGKNVRIVRHLSQPADHPVNLYHPEGEYLKGLVLSVSEL